ncbi:MAG: DNA primase, partial [Phycisphaerales bacterium]|nr:DNA primase [Phycisphaerales bacterium]
YVVPAKQIFHCFVCGAGGNALDFVMRYHGMTFIEALKFLAQKAGVELTQRQPEHRTRADATPGEIEVSRDDLAAATRTAASFFTSILRHPEHGAAARAVIERRGISPEMVEAFGLGAAPARWDGLVQTIHARNLPEAHFVAAGLLKTREHGGGHYDTFRNRLIFPIHDQLGRAVAFGGRIIDPEDTPKYLNSPESVLFDKGSTLFGLPQALAAIKSTRTAIVTEGYTDVIACHQAGIRNVVATLGTALTERHARLLRRLCDEVILLFDGDEAGQRAADRAFEVFFLEPVDIRVATLPGGRDPDELLREEGGRVGFDAAMSAARDAVAFRLDRLEAGLAGHAPDSATRVRAVEEELSRLVELGLHELAPLRRQALLRRLARVSGLGEQAVLAAVPRRRPQRAAVREAEGDRPAAEAADGAAGSSSAPSTLEHLLGCLLHDPALATENRAALDDILACPAYRSGPAGSVVAAIAHLLESKQSPGLSEVLGIIEDVPARQLATGLTLHVATITDDDRERLRRHWTSCVARLASESERPARDVPDPDAAAGEATARDLLVAGLARRQSAHRERGTANAPVLPRVR